MLRMGELVIHAQTVCSPKQKENAGALALMINPATEAVPVKMPLNISDSLPDSGPTVAVLVRSELQILGK